jgi:outer membrane receptor protein involved in Fe transport
VASILVALLLLFLNSSPLAQQQPVEDPTEQSEQTQQDETKDEPFQSELTERVVVSASATVQSQLDAPAAVDVIDGDDLEQQPGELLVDHLRRVPGINVAQFGSRDVNIASRSATGGINNSTLALADDRSLYQDFLGVVLWEFAPTDSDLVEQVEVVRGPASAIWGANAVGGVVHVITKSPRDTLGGEVRAEAGSHNSHRLLGRHSFLAGPWAVRIAASTYESDAFDRPETITNFFGETIDPDLGLVDDAPLADTRQPRLDVRADWDAADGGRWILQAGWGQTSGWIATGLGPFDIESGASMSHVQARYQKGPYDTQFFSNYFDGDAVNLINEIPFGFTSTLTQASFRGRNLLAQRGVFGWGVELSSSSYDLNIAPGGDERNKAGAFAELDLVLADKWKLVGGARFDHFRETVGTVFSPRVALRFKPNANHTVRVAWGRAFRSPSLIETDLLVPSIPVALLDWVEVDQELIDQGTLPPGTSFFALMAEGICSTQPDNCGEPPGEIPIYTAVTAASGSTDLDEERTDSLEVGYVARIGRVGISATVYTTESEGGIDFPQAASYGYGPDALPGTADDIILPTDPDGDGIDEAPPVDVCPFGLDLFEPFDELCPQGPVPYNHALSILLDGQVPSLFQYDNGAEVENWGIELGANWAGPKGITGWLNYSWQHEPRSDGVSMSTRIDRVLRETEANSDLDGDGLVADTSAFVNIPAEHRVSLGVQIDRTRWFASLAGDHVAEAFWQDVLTSDFWGYTAEYTLVGVGGGWRWPGHGLELSAQVTNIFDDVSQQHIYGDLIGRRASVSLGYAWSPE